MLTLVGMTADMLVAVNLFWHFECYFRFGDSLFDSAVVEVGDRPSVHCHIL